MTPTFTVKHTNDSTQPWTVSCSCGHLSVPVVEAEVGLIIRIHWQEQHADV